VVDARRRGNRVRPFRSGGAHRARVVSLARPRRVRTRTGARRTQTETRRRAAAPIDGICRRQRAVAARRGKACASRRGRRIAARAARRSGQDRHDHESGRRANRRQERPQFSRRSGRARTRLASHVARNQGRPFRHRSHHARIATRRHVGAHDAAQSSAAAISQAGARRRARAWQEGGSHHRGRGRRANGSNSASPSMGRCA